MKGAVRIFIVGALGVICSACSVTRHIPEGSYLVQKVTVREDKETPRRQRITADELERYIRQTPNKRLLGTNFYVWLYEQADSSKQNGWNNWKRRIGQAPVLLDRSLMRKSVENLKIYMNSRGYYASQAFCEVDTIVRRRRVKMTYRVRQHQPYRIGSIGYAFRDRFLEQLVLPDTVHTLLHRGDIFNISVLDSERERITARLRERGYFNFTVNNIEYVADTLQNPRQVGLRVVIKPYLSGYDAQGQPVIEDNVVYRIDRINVFPNYRPDVSGMVDTTVLSRLDTIYYRGLNIIYEGKPNLRPKILRQSIPLYPNYIYNSAQVNRAYTDLMALGYFRSARIAFVEEPRTVDETNYVTYVGEHADSTRTESVREGYLACNILCTPTLRQSFKVDLEGSTTSSFYGLKATVGYQNRNIFRGAESFDASFSMGYEFMKAPDARKRRAEEFGVSTGLTFPRFLVPWSITRFGTVNQPKTKLELSFNYQDRPYYRRTLTSAGMTYQWTNSSYSSFSLRPIDINVVDVSYLDPDFLSNTENLYLINSYQTQLIAGLTFSYGYNNQLKNLGRNATVIRFNAETAGNLVGGLAHWLTSPVRTADESYYKVFGIRYSQYFRFDMSLSRKIMLGAKTALAGRLYGGLAMAYGNSTSVPFDRLFYAGGSNGMRGWTHRTLGPGSVPRPESDFPSQLGDMKLEANLEFRFPIWGII
ncbi:MAG: BamA/TamA family outer membrane protein, partial [Alistipes sp.]|nr:BamA/TamA family outer membrane protein [Alistipes sp.]